MSDIDLSALAKPFPPEVISWRVGSMSQDKKRGMALAYIDARDVQDRLDEVCGPANWQCRNPWAVGGKLACEIGIRVDGEWIWKGDGAGDTDVEAEKGAFSDAFKRAAVRWGLGRYLYDLDTPWVELESAGRSYRITDREMQRLRTLLAKGLQFVQPNDRQAEPVAQRVDHARPEPYLLPVPMTRDGLKTNWLTWVNDMAELINGSATVDEVNAWIKANNIPLGNLKTQEPEGFAYLKDQAEKRRQYIAQSPDLKAVA